MLVLDTPTVTFQDDICFPCRPTPKHARRTWVGGFAKRLFRSSTTAPNTAARADEQLPTVRRGVPAPEHQDERTKAAPTMAYLGSMDPHLLLSARHPDRDLTARTHVLAFFVEWTVAGFSNNLVCRAGIAPRQDGCLDVGSRIHRDHRPTGQASLRQDEADSQLEDSEGGWRMCLKCTYLDVILSRQGAG